MFILALTLTKLKVPEEVKLHTVVFPVIPTIEHPVACVVPAAE
jgi:hypothetical protein